MNQSESDRLTETLGTDVVQLLKANWIDGWSYRLEERPVEFVLKLVINPLPDGRYELKSKVSYGVKVTRSYQRTLEAPSKASRLHSVAA